MAVTFPSSPNLNDTVSDPTVDALWIWDGAKWTNTFTEAPPPPPVGPSTGWLETTSASNAPAGNPIMLSGSAGSTAVFPAAGNHRIALEADLGTVQALSAAGTGINLFVYSATGLPANPAPWAGGAGAWEVPTGHKGAITLALGEVRQIGLASGTTAAAYAIPAGTHNFRLLCSIDSGYVFSIYAGMRYRITLTPV